MDFTASDTAELTGLSRRSATNIYDWLRGKIAGWSTRKVSMNPTSVPSEFQASAAAEPVKKTIVFGIFKRQGKVDPMSIIHSNGWYRYDGLVNVGYDKHYRVQHSQDEFVSSSSHINGIESFWSFAKRRLTQFNGVPKHTFYLRLKETEFRFNQRIPRRLALGRGGKFENLRFSLRQKKNVFLLNTSGPVRV